MENEINLNLDENIIFYDFIKNIENNNKNFYNNDGCNDFYRNY